MDKQKQAPAKPVKVRVRARYGPYAIGSIIEVNPKELRIAPHALISLEEEQRLEEERLKVEPTDAQRGFRQLNKAMIAASEAQGEAKRVQMQRHLHALGVDGVEKPPESKPTAPARPLGRDVKADAKPEATPEAKADVKPDAKVDAKAEKAAK
jgi:hypothetical protein